MFERYAKQLSMPEIGCSGQSKLAASSALVVGAGGLGSPVLYYLAAAGVGRIHIVDSDSAEISNLNRQLIHFEEDIGRAKALSAKEKLARFNHEITVTHSAIRLCEENAKQAIAGYDIVVSCVDNIPTRILLNKNCVENCLPLVDGGVKGLTGYVLTVLPGITPCYQCIFPHARQDAEAGGVLGAAAGVVGSIMTVQAVKCLLGIGGGDNFLLADLNTLSFSNIEAKIDPQCPVCRKHG